MAMPRKSDPVKYCEFCGTLLVRKRFPSGLEDMGAFRRRKYCNQKCMAAAFDARPSVAKLAGSQRYHARKIVPPRPCEICGAENALDVHHKDHNTANNDPSNLMRICRSCHNKIHRKRKLCVVCGKPQKGHGYCAKHLERYKKYGNPLLLKRNQHKDIHIVPSENCSQYVVSV